jgi:hypothetical protein
VLQLHWVMLMPTRDMTDNKPPSWIPYYPLNTGYGRHQSHHQRRNTNIAPKHTGNTAAWQQQPLTH